MTSWCGSPAHHQDAVAGRWNSGSYMVINVCLVERNWHHSSLQLRRQREPQRVAQMTRKKKQKKLGNDKICKWLMSCKTMNQVRIRFWYLIGLAGFGVTNRNLRHLLVVLWLVTLVMVQNEIILLLFISFL